MERTIGSCYPLHIGFSGPIEHYQKDVEIDSLSGVYLDYLLASVYTRNLRVTLNFGPDLAPQLVQVEKDDGVNIAQWSVNNLSDQEIDEICDELNLSREGKGVIEISREILKSMYKRDFLCVPAYRFEGAVEA